MAPILLPSRGTTVSSFDDSGVLVKKSVLPKYVNGPYTPGIIPDHLAAREQLLFVPPLQYFCIKSLVQDVDLIDLGGYGRIPYYPESHLPVLRAFIPFFDADTLEKDMMYVDPRVWGALIQIYSGLPECFSTYPVPLSDTHLTMLQGIKSTANFTLLTVLDLASQPNMNDETIDALKPLSNLCVLDLSRTSVGSWGVRKLSMCLTGNGGERRGPWNLRVWSLRSCRGVDNSVKDSLSKFPLLSVIDLRDTSVTPALVLKSFKANPPACHNKLYYPYSPLEWIPALCELFPQSRVFEADSLRSPPHVFHINRLCHRYTEARERRQQVADQDTVLMLFPGGKQAIDTIYGLTQATEEREAEQKRHEAWLRSDAHQRPSQEYGRDVEPQDEESDNGHYDDVGMCIWEYGYHDCSEHYYESEESVDDEYDDMGLYDLDLQMNAVAALVASQQTAESEAFRFYAKSNQKLSESPQRIRGGALPSDIHRMGWDRARDGRRPSSQRADFSSAEDGGQHHFMFFRVPPNFDSVPDKQNVDTIKRKNLDAEIISMKKQKGCAVITDPSELLWHRKHMATHANKPEGQENKDPTNFSPVSMNPFLAKKRRPSQQLNNSHSPSLSYSGTSGAILLPTNSPQVDKPRSASRLRNAGQRENTIRSRPESTKQILERSKASTKPAKFDMKAWFTHPKIS